MEKLEIKNLSKRYKNFKIENLSFDIKGGSIVGLIGENGAGKSTVIKSILGIVHADGGRILFDGKDMQNLTREERQKIAFVLDDVGLPEELTLKMLKNVLPKVFVKWNGDEYFRLLKKLELPENVPIKNFSKGMKMKTAIAVALSRESELLILDEPTSGLDPVVLDEILSMLYDYNNSENRAVLISSHITSDLEKLCDYIVYLHKGEIVINEEKDALLSKYAVYGIDKSQLNELDKSAVLKVIERDYGMDILALKDKMPESFECRATGLEDIMLFYSKGEDL